MTACLIHHIESTRYKLYDIVRTGTESRHLHHHNFGILTLWLYCTIYDAYFMRNICDIISNHMPYILSQSSYTF